MQNIVCKVTKITFTAVLGCIFLVMLFLQSIDYSCKIDFLLSNLCILGILIALCFLSTVLYYFYKKKNPSVLTRREVAYDKLAAVFTVILFIGQVFVFCSIFFFTGWDVWGIVESARDLAIGDYESFILDHGEYYCVYPNNLLLVYLNALILKLNNAIGLFPAKYDMMSGVVINCVINSLTCYLVYKTAKLFTKKKYAFLGYCIAVVSIGISPWSVIFYSDSVGLIIPILSFYLYVKPVSKRIIRYIYRFCALFTGIIGYFIKPQCAIMLIAIIIIEILKLFENFNPKKLIKPAAIILSAVICFSVITLSVNKTTEKIGFEIDKEKTFGLTHFFMMGLDESCGGTYSLHDVNFSNSFETAKERAVANLGRAVERLKSMGILGYAKHITKKMLTTFNDGTFAWCVEGSFFKYVPEDLNSNATLFLRSVYYNTGSRYHYFSFFEQIVWIVVLIGSIFSGLIKARETNKNQLSILWLSILGLILFECLFEVRARYLYTFVPVFCVLATIGIKEISQFIKIKTESLISERGN